MPPPERTNTRTNRIDLTDSDALFSALKTILNSTKNHQSAWPFQIPVDRKVVSRYFEEKKKLLRPNYFPLYKYFKMTKSCWIQIE